MAILLDENKQWHDSSGNLIVNGKIFVGTQNQDPTLGYPESPVNLISIFSDRALTIPLSNPQLTGSDGRSVNKIWIDDGKYSLTVWDSEGAQEYVSLDEGEVRKYTATETDAAISAAIKTHPFDTLALAVADIANISIGDVIYPKDRGGTWDAVDATTVTENEYNIVTGNATISFQLRTGVTLHAKQWGVVGDGVADDGAAIIAMITSLSDGMNIDFNGLDMSVYNGVTGIASGTDAVPITDAIRLYGLNDITLKNGHIFAYDPKISASLLNYPTTLTIDGCTNIRLKNLKLEGKGQSYGDTDGSAGLGDEARREFAAKNGGHALLIVRSRNVNSYDSQFRLCGSVATYYVMSSHQINAYGCFSNPGSLGYAAYAFDSWAGEASVSGFPSHHSTLSGCSTSKEGYTYASKGCVLTEDSDVTCEVNGGYYADASPNGVSRDIGYAFGCASSQTIVNGATVENCASVGYTAPSNADHSHLLISNVNAIGLTKTVHQNKDSSFGTLRFKYTNCEFDVVGGAVWVGDGDLTREETSYVAMPNPGNTIYGRFSGCTFTGATYGIISTYAMFGYLKFNYCSMETNGYLWNTANIGSGSSRKSERGIHFNHSDIVDISAITTAYTVLASTTVYTYIDLSTSTITLNSARDIESSTISTPGTFIDMYRFPQDESNIETITVAKTLYPNSAKIQVITPSGADRAVNLPRPDKYKYIEFKIINADATNNVLVRDYTNVTTYLTLAPGQAAITWNDGSNDYVRLL